MATNQSFKQLSSETIKARTANPTGAASMCRNGENISQCSRINPSDPQVTHQRRPSGCWWVTCGSLGLILLHCDMFSPFRHIEAAPVGFAVRALIVSDDNCLNDWLVAIRMDAAAQNLLCKARTNATQTSAVRSRQDAGDGTENRGLPDGCRWRGR